VSLTEEKAPARKPDIFTRLKAMTPDQRSEFYKALSQNERNKLVAMMEERKSNPYLSFVNDPVGFVTSPQGLDEIAWSLQREIMTSVRDNKRTAVPACHAPGKSHIAARIIAWWGSVHPAGTARILTTATTFRQVRNVLWPYIRNVHAAHGLPGTMNMVEWYIDTGGNRELVAEGIKPPDEDEAALSGMHAPHVLIVVDEAGGISHLFGRGLLGLLTGSHTRLLLIGNPPIDDEGSWFEKQCERTDLFNVIPIPYSKTPNFTGEDLGLCRSHKGMEPHTVASHLIDADYVQDLVDEYGEESAVVIARRDAQFPKSNESKTLPIMWLEAARLPRKKNGEVEDDFVVPTGGEIQLGMDIAGGMSDEFVIAAIDTGVATTKYGRVDERHRDSQYVVSVCAKWARWAAAEHKKRGISAPVRAKVDSLGLGWHIYGDLKRLSELPVSQGGIAGVVFLEVKAGSLPRDVVHFTNVRDEMWWAMRKAVMADSHGQRSIILDVDDKTVAQMNAPKYGEDARGKIKIEPKASMLKRGIRSGDRADGIIMAWYEPDEIHEFYDVAPIIISSGTSSSSVLRSSGAPSDSTSGSDSAGFVAL